MRCLGDWIQLLDKLCFAVHAPRTRLLQRSGSVHAVAETSHESTCGIFNSVSRVHIQSLGLQSTSGLGFSDQELGAICSHFPML